VLLLLAHVLTGAVARPGYCNGQHANGDAFAVLDASGAISAWGSEYNGGSGAPTGGGFVSVASTGYAFAALDAWGTISAWGSSSYGGSGAPTGSGFVSIASNEWAFAALDASGAISAWGGSSYGGSGAPTGSGFVSTASTYGAFAAIDASGAISAWGDSGYGGTSDISAGPRQDYGKQGHWRTEWMRPVGGVQQLTKPPPSSGHAGLGRGEQWGSAALSGHVPHWLAVCVLAAFCLWCAKDGIRSRLRDASVNGARSRAASWGNAPRSGANRPARASVKAVHSALYSAARPQAKTLGVVEGLSRLPWMLTILLLVMSAGVHSVACFCPSGACPEMPLYP